MAGEMHVISAAAAPALGDVRAAGEGDWIYVMADAKGRKDFARYWEAIGVAVVRGAGVAMMRGEAE